MSIAFDQDRWAAVIETSRAWWAGRLDRPLIQIRLHGRTADRPEPAVPLHRFQSFYDPAITAEQIVDRIDYELSRQEFLGDAFPTAWANFGPGVLAAFLGARLENGQDTVWFQPEGEVQLADLDVRLDPDNPWFRRVADLGRAAGQRWEGLVQFGITDLGGAVDVLSTFRPGERLLLDLYDHPDQVEARVWDVHAAWFAAYEQLHRDLHPPNPGYTAWTPIFSERPYYMLQCDFCYMIGPDMFDRFVKPELDASCRRLAHPFYHLDGPGQLPHLDSLLSIESLKGVQWVPGAGQPGAEAWPEVYRRIRAAGKLIQVFSGQSPLGWRLLDVLAEQLGGAAGICLIGEANLAERDEVMRFLRRHGAED